MQFIDDRCAVTSDVGFSPPMEMTMAGWGDIAQLSAGEPRAVNDTVGVEETVFILQKFAGLGGPPGMGGLPIKARTDMFGVFAIPSPRLDGVISVSEIAAIVDAFGGTPYPFTPISIP